jgi:hypothetical protein
MNVSLGSPEIPIEDSPKGCHTILEQVEIAGGYCKEDGTQRSNNLVHG